MIALVDSGASISAIKKSTAKKLVCKEVEDSSERKIRAVNNCPVKIDSFVQLNVFWKSKKTNLKKVAVLRSAPFSLILGIDWIIQSECSLVAKEGALAVVPPQIMQQANVFPQTDSEGSANECQFPLVSDDLLATFTESQPEYEPPWPPSRTSGPDGLNCVEDSPFFSKVQIGSNASAAEKEQILKLLNRHRRCFPANDRDFGRTTAAEHSIDTGDAKPIRTAPYRVSPCERRLINEKVSDMIRDGIVQPSTSPWAAPVVMVRKKNNEHRFCVDFRKLNSVTRRDMYPLPRVDDVLERLAGAKYFTCLDLKSGYWQVPVSVKDRHKTAFVTPDGLFEFNAMPFGLANAPPTFQRLMDTVLGSLKWTACMVYLDDILVFGRTFEEHLHNLSLVLTALEKANLKLNVAKCIFSGSQVTHLGHVISEEGIRPDESKTAALRNFKVVDLKSLRSFIGLASYYRRFVPDFARIAQPLHALMKKNVRWSWTAQHEEAKAALIDKLCTAPVLAHFNETLETEIQTDASLSGLGAVLSQKSGNGFRPVSFISRRLTSSESRYASNELECLALVWALKKFKPYVYGSKFTVRTDNSAVKWLCEKKELTGKFARWILSLQEFDFSISHIKGSLNSVADALSRNPDASRSGPGGCETERHVVSLFVSDQKKLRPKELAFLQKLDRHLRPIILETEKVMSPSQKLKSEFVLKNGVLFKRSTRGRFQLAVPSQLQEQILFMCHDSPLSGHLGIEKTLARVTSRYWWPRLAKCVKNYVLSCVYCQSHKPSTRKRHGFLRPIPPPKRPFHTIGIDHIGPFKLTTNKNTHAVVAIDYLSKWVEAEPVPGTSTDHVLTFLRKNIINRHGVPRRLISDQGPAFASRQMADFLSDFNIKHVLVTPEHPEGNGQVERVNRTLASALAPYLNSRHTDWDTKLTDAVFAINTARQSATQESPFLLVYGREPNAPADNLFPWPAEKPESTRAFVRRVNRLRKTVRHVLLAKQRKTKKRVDATRQRAPEYAPGDLVLVRRNLSKKGLTKKFLRKFVGPFQVISQVAPTTYQVEDVSSSRRKSARKFHAHVCQMKKFNMRQRPGADDEEVVTVEKDPEPEEEVEPVQQTQGPSDVSESVPSTPPPVRRVSRYGRTLIRPAYLDQFDTS